MDRILRVILVITLASVLTLGLLIAGCGGETIQTPEAGKVAPDFELDTLDGETVVLSELWGKPVLLNFWATWCMPCCQEMPHLQQFYDERQEQVALLTINIKEDSSKVAQFVQSQGFSFPVLLDTKGEVAAKYGIRAIPTTLLIDEYGFLQDANVGSFRSTAEIESLLSKLD